MVHVVEMEKSDFGSVVLFAVTVYGQLIHGWLLDSHFGDVQRQWKQNGT
jgi:hypothetical protein